MATVSGTLTAPGQSGNFLFLRAGELATVSVSRTGSNAWSAELVATENQPPGRLPAVARFTSTTTGFTYRNETNRPLYLTIVAGLLSPTESIAFTIADVTGDVILQDWVAPDGSLAFRITDEGPIGGVVGPTFNVKAFGAKGDGITDDTAAIQRALDAAGGPLNTNQIVRNRVFFPAGQYRFSQLVVKNGVSLWGSGVGGYGSIDSGGQYGTELRQIAGTNDDGIVLRGIPNSEFVGPLDFRDFILMGDPTASAGSGIRLGKVDGTDATVADTCTFKNLLIRGWKDDGIHFTRGAVPVHVQDVNVLFNGRYGIYYSAPENVGVTQAVHFDCVSGDGNLLGLIYCQNVNPDYGSILFTNIKSEKRINFQFGNVVGQEDCIILHNCRGPIAINGLTHISSVPDGVNFEEPGAAIRITGTNAPDLSFMAVAVRVRPSDTGGTAYTLNDTTNSRTIPRQVHFGTYMNNDANATQVAYHFQSGAGGLLRMLLGTEMYPGIIGAPEFQITGPTPLQTFFQTNAGVDEKGWGWGSSGDNFALRSFADDGTSGTFPLRVYRGTGTAVSDVAISVPLSLTDGIIAPATIAGRAQIYVDTADGDLKIKFGDGTVKTIVTDT
jgi:hypothetical protein